MKSTILFLSLFISTSQFFNPGSKIDVVKDQSKKENFADDWAALSKYQKENDLLRSQGIKENSVVFLGSSTFEFWKQKRPEYFSKNPYICRGISGQISPQLLVRFRQDVINLKPGAVIILAGSNDIAGNTGHVTNDKIMDNIKSMSELAKLHDIKVILCKYLPIYAYPWNKDIHPAEKIVALNQLIEGYARENKFTILDYWTPLVDDKKGQREELTVDGVHPNLAGYKIMETVTDKAINEALKRK
ncbi:lysophospholipase L1-like esterase [Pedobacter psychrotolerans]|uniref:Lipase n=1 Tax=Pedobacter psychrotolerans TaxID=1843235 RepID=A0A4R2HHE0_9SPHI|nr:GDSL-type esterase/lipase family protein [Pedobacter psychrotolerans]TCO28601.1 lysophospholipase L1-like esterase [Pedobacter psychrotolerans]GGE50378.1 lipase [Pedobacter psychrotolerans]